MERILDNVAAATAVIPPIPMTDGELLMQYSRHGDEAAFAKLVQKHGRLVWTVCWQVLRQHHEIEDAFQSTFFILAKRARSIRSCDSLCGWLYRVAYRTALRARISSVRKPLLELMADDLESLDDKFTAIEQHEQRSVLLEELHSLPEQYQLPLVLCYLEGKSRGAIAAELGCSVEAIKGRLARGKQVLRHRLIRRGVSLSLAMGAMVVPVKAATAAVTPGLVGMTVTGAAGWAAGTAAAAKISTTVSAHVLQLAHQGTVAMTISSLAKPIVLAVALLGAVSVSVAVDQSEHSGTSSAEQLIDLQATAEAEGEAATTREDDGVEVVMASEDGKKSDTLRAKKVAIDFADDKKFQFEVAPPMPLEEGTLRIAAPADVLVPSLPRMPAAPLVEPFNIRVPEPMSLKLHVKIAELEKNVTELQLKSKELEIKSFDAEEEEDREELLNQSRRVLMEAEAEQLKIQIERQKAQIEELEKALHQTADELGKHAAKSIEARIAYEPEFAKMKLKAEAAAMMAGEDAKAAAHQAAEHARAAVEQAKGAAVAKAVHAADLARKIAEQAKAKSVAHAKEATKKSKAAKEKATKDAKPADQSGAMSLSPGDHIRIEVAGAFPDRPIDDVFVIEPMGTVALGVGYGRVEVKGLSVIDAEKAIVDHLKEILSDVEVQVTFVRSNLINYADFETQQLPKEEE